MSDDEVSLTLLDPKDASEHEKFALMIHDRLIDIERELRGLQPPPMDSAVTLLGTKTRSDTGAVFVRLRSGWNVDLSVLASKTLATLGRLDRTRFDLWACQHFGLSRTSPYVIEMLVERSPVYETVCVAKVAHAALDSLRDMVRPLRLKAPVEAEVCAVGNPKWFAESIRLAGAATNRAVLYSWDPQADTMVQQDCNALDEMGTRDERETRAWTLLHGWLAHHTDPTDLWHPKGLSSAKASMDLVAALADVV